MMLQNLSTTNSWIQNYCSAVEVSVPAVPGHRRSSPS